MGSKSSCKHITRILTITHLSGEQVLVNMSLSYKDSKLKNCGTELIVKTFVFLCHWLFLQSDAVNCIASSMALCTAFLYSCPAIMQLKTLLRWIGTVYSKTCE